MVTERPPGKVVGAFVGDDSSAVHVIERATGVTVAVEWSKVRSIEVRRGRRTAMEAFARGAKAGALVAGSIAVVGIATAIVWDARGGCEGVERR